MGMQRQLTVQYGLAFLCYYARAMRARRLVATLVLPLLLLGGLAATCAIVGRSPKRIILASDSKMVFSNNTSETGCKTHVYGELFFTLAGIPYDRSRGYDVQTLVEKGFSRPGNFRQHVRVTKGLVRRAIARELLRLKREDARQYAWAMEDGDDPLQLALAEFENGEPQLAVLEFKINGDVVEYSCPGDCVGGTHAYYLGQHGAIDAFLKTNPVVDMRDIPMLMSLEINDKPGVVGEPINILELTSNGPRWLAGGSACQLR
jgi:hypothetical protein